MSFIEFPHPSQHVSEESWYLCRFSIPVPVSQISNSNKVSLFTWFVLAVSSMSPCPTSPSKLYTYSHWEKKRKTPFPLALMTSSVINELIKISKSSGLDKDEERKVLYCNDRLWGCPLRCHGSVTLRMCASNHLLIFISKPSSRSWQGPVWESQWINNDFLDCWGLCTRVRGLYILKHDDTSNQYTNYWTSYCMRHSHVFSLLILWRGL
jgi:hypothetical protein